MIDSGIDAGHSEFEPEQVVAWKDFVNGRESPYDDFGHGTAVASRAAGRTLGAYPRARLAVAKVLSYPVAIYPDVVALAIRWAADLGAASINLSFGAGGLPGPDQWGGAAAEAIHYARTKGSLVVWAAGNEGARFISSMVYAPFPIPANTKWGSSSPEALVVGAAGIDGRPAVYSQWVPEVTARGDAVEVALPGNVIEVSSGTSFAAPWVAGAAARLVAAGAPRDVDWLKWVILHEAFDNPNEPYTREGYGWINEAGLANAVAVARGERPVPGLDARDAFHLAAMHSASALSQQPPAGTTKP